MENSQNVQHEPTQTTGATPELTNSKSRVISNSQFLINLLARHPWLLLIGLSAMFFASAVLALYNLGSVGNVEQPEASEQNPEVATVAEETINTPSEIISNPTPLWMIAAIALSCASGCLIILRILNHPGKGKTIQKHIKRYPTRSVQSQPSKVESAPPKNPQVFVPPPSLTTPLASMQSRTKPLMTVLPPEHSYRMDQSKQSLADLMDLRKQSSLSALLRK